MTGPQLSLTWLGTTDATVVINLHLFFNAMVALLALPFLSYIMTFAEALITERTNPAGATEKLSALDPAALKSPDRALSCAAREIMRMGEMTESMLRKIALLYQRWDDETARLIIARAQNVQEIHFELKLYLAALNRMNWTAPPPTDQRTFRRLQLI